VSQYVLALDQGTTSSRSIVFDRAGRVVAMAQQEFPQIFPGPGHVEHDPERSGHRSCRRRSWRLPVRASAPAIWLRLA